MALRRLLLRAFAEDWLESQDLSQLFRLQLDAKTAISDADVLKERRQFKASEPEKCKLRAAASRLQSTNQAPAMHTRRLRDIARSRNIRISSPRLDGMGVLGFCLDPNNRPDNY